MKLARVLCLIVVAVLFVGFAADKPVQAQGINPYGVGGFAYPGWFGYRASPYSLGQIPVPPYYSLHPPVYYSVPVPRTYGHSPYAYPGFFRTPEVEISEVINNPHVNGDAEVTPTKTVSNRPVMIENPYVRAELRTNHSTQYAAVDQE